MVRNDAAGLRDACTLEVLYDGQEDPDMSCNSAVPEQQAPLRPPWGGYTANLNEKNLATNSPWDFDANFDTSNPN